MKLVAWMGNLGVCLEYCRVQEGRRVQHFLPFSFDLLRLRFGNTIGILAQDEIFDGSHESYLLGYMADGTSLSGV